MIYLLRHGLDDESFIGGWSDVDLISAGIKQVENTRDYIVDNKLLINNIISSDIKRAKENEEEYLLKEFQRRKAKLPIYPCLLKLLH